MILMLPSLARVRRNQFCLKVTSQQVDSTTSHWRLDSDRWSTVLCGRNGDVVITVQRHRRRHQARYHPPHRDLNSTHCRVTSSLLLLLRPITALQRLTATAHQQVRAFAATLSFHHLRLPLFISPPPPSPSV